MRLPRGRYGGHGAPRAGGEGTAFFAARAAEIAKNSAKSVAKKLRVW